MPELLSSVSTPAKARAARRNAKLGGWPKAHYLKFIEGRPGAEQLESASAPNAKVSDRPPTDGNNLKPQHTEPVRCTEC